MWSAIAIVASLLVGYIVYKIAQARKPDGDIDYDEADYYDDDDEEDDEPENYFDYLTVTEQFDRAKTTHDNLLMIEKIISDLSYSDTDNQTVVNLSWTDSEGKSHTYALYCDGRNTASECIMRIARREAVELRTTLSDQCQRLARSAQGRAFSEKIPYGARKIFENESGEGCESDNESLSDVRKAYRMSRQPKEIL